MKIDSITAREVLDSRGNPTIEVELLYKNFRARAIAPSGASTGIFEAHELRDKDEVRYFGLGVLSAIENVVNKIGPELKNIDFNDQKAVDAALIELDDTKNKSNLGANAIVATSMAAAKLAADVQNISLYKYINLLFEHNFNLKISPSLPVPLVNIINGGMHANNGIAFQEFMIVPKGISDFRQQIRACAEIFHALKIILKKEGYSIAVGDEGGFAPKFTKNSAMFCDENQIAIEYILKAIEQANYKPGIEIFLALDVAASTFYNQSSMKYSLHTNNAVNDLDFNEYYGLITEKFPIISIEDALREDANNEYWQGLMKNLAPKNIQIVGDDLFVTNSKMLQEGIKNNIANAILIKPNQVGTLWETLETIAIAYNAGYKYIISHRSGDSEDVFISHLAVGSGAGQIKTGSVCRGERTAKYNELLRIYENFI